MNRTRRCAESTSSLPKSAGPPQGANQPLGRRSVVGVVVMKFLCSVAIDLPTSWGTWPKVHSRIVAVACSHAPVSCMRAGCLISAKM